VRIRAAEMVPLRTIVTTGSTIELDLTHPERVAGGPAVGRSPVASRTEVNPLTPRETRIHLTFSPKFVALLKRAKVGQSRVQPGAADDQVLTAALELLIAKQEKRSASVLAKVRWIGTRGIRSCARTAPSTS